MLGDLGKKGRTRLGTSKEEQKNNNTGTIIWSKDTVLGKGTKIGTLSM